MQIPLLILLSACASTGEEAITAEPESKPEVEQPASETNQDVVGTDGLTADLLYELLLSSVAFQRGEIQVASDALLKAAHLTDDPVVVSRAVRMAVHSENYVQGVELGQRWIELSPSDHQAYIITALAAVMNDQPDIGLEVLRELLAQDSAQINLRFGQLGELFLQHTEGETSQSVLQQLADEHAGVAEAWLVLAGMAQKNEDFSVMDSSLDRVLELEPGSEKAASYKLVALAGKESEQTAFAESFLETYPRAHGFRMQYAQLLLRREDDVAALEQLLSLLEYDSGNSEAMNLVALLYQAREEYPQAAEYFAMRLEAVPGDDRTRLYLANAYQQLERYDEAKQVLAEVSDETEVFNAGRQMALLIEEADGADAGVAYLRTLRGSSEAEAVQLVVDQQQMLQRAGRSEEAYALVNQALEQYPDNENLRYHRALVAVEWDHLEIHEADMRVLLELEPDNPHYNNTLGYTLLITDEKRLKEAARLINRALELKPDDPYILDSKGWLEYKLGHNKAALEYLLKAFSIDRDAEIAAHIGEVYWVMDQREKAREFWLEGDKIDPDNKALKAVKERYLN